VPKVRCSRRLAASPAEVWQVVGDPHHLPRWWPRVSRVEAVEGDEFTEVLRSAKGKTVRADFRLLDEERERRVVWSQQIEGTPFARVLRSAETEIELAPVESVSTTLATPGFGEERSQALVSAEAAPGTEVSIEMRQSLHGVFPRMGSWLVRRAATATLGEALDGLERIFG
jgi:uncharacterized protein YndB with AHSA1/START domain